MNLIKALNAVSSQVWAGFLLAFGVMTLVLANFGRAPQVVPALLGAGTSMVGGALILFQHQTKIPTDAEPTPAIDPPQVNLEKKG